LKLLTARKSSKGFEVRSETSGAEVPSYAFIGVRACELNAIHIQDRVFGSGQFTDPTYRARREKAFVVAVNCTQAGGTCFCVSMNTGPRVGDGFDISLTEVVRDENHFFLAAVGSGRGSEVMDELQHSAAGESDVDAAEGLVNETALHMGRELAADGMRDRLFTHIESPRWDDVAKRCLTCTNCTLVCPTCFCSTIEEVTDLGGTTAERWRRWDSCFTLDFAKVAGGNFRYSVWSRYRQWLTHKLAYWIDQFGTSGCVGCGRCITWCPAGIDITVEAQAVVGVEPQEPKGD
jgi:ferredoxin